MLDHLNKVNSNINRLTLSALSFSANDGFLEVGFGGGALISDVLKTHPSVRVFGVEVSALAVEFASQRFESEIRSGKVRILKSDDTGLPFEDGFVDSIASVNVIYFVADVEKEFKEAHRVLKHGGFYVLSYAEGSPDRVTRFPLEKVETLLRRAGFENVKSVHSKDSENGDFYCTKAQKPGQTTFTSTEAANAT